MTEWSCETLNNIETPISKTIIMAMTKGAITVFAPTDEAMARLDEETRAKVREIV